MGRRSGDSLEMVLSGTTWHYPFQTIRLQAVASRHVTLPKLPGKNKRTRTPTTILWNTAAIPY
eukprot:753909-Amorphochlora_amoeboformis.AAC.1